MAMATTLIVATHAQAIDLGLGIFKKKKPEPVAATPTKAEPVQQVKKLLTILQSDSDVEHRKTAAEELRTLDPRANPEIIAQLVASMQKDPSPTVRAAAADSLGAIKHVYPAAGTALEAVEKGDPNADVRSAAKAAIWQYSLNGYKATATADLGQTAEPPLSTKRPTVTPNPSTVGQADAAFRPITQGIGKGAFFQQTTEPPLAKAKPKAPPAVVPETNPVI